MHVSIIEIGTQILSNIRCIRVSNPGSGLYRVFHVFHVKWFKSDYTNCNFAIKSFCKKRCKIIREVTAIFISILEDTCTLNIYRSTYDKMITKSVFDNPKIFSVHNCKWYGNDQPPYCMSAQCHAQNNLDYHTVHYLSTKGAFVK